MAACPLQGAAFAMPSRGSRQVVLAFPVARSFGAELGLYFLLRHNYYPPNYD
jgi:hypothetical protein